MSEADYNCAVDYCTCYCLAFRYRLPLTADEKYPTHGTPSCDDYHEPGEYMHIMVYILLGNYG